MSYQRESVSDNWCEVQRAFEVLRTELKFYQRWPSHQPKPVKRVEFCIKLAVDLANAAEGLRRALGKEECRP